MLDKHEVVDMKFFYQLVRIEILELYFSIHCVCIYWNFHTSEWYFYPSATGGRWFFSTSAAGIILWMHPASEKSHYIVTSLIGWVDTQHDPCISLDGLHLFNNDTHPSGHINGLIQERHNSIANALLELRLSCTNPSILVVLPIDIENPYRLSNCLYRYISIYIGFLATIF